jgi:predicted nucleic acid-binding protein
MSAVEAFHDTNILLYLASSDVAKADLAEALITGGGHVSIQVLNEFASVATRRFDMTWAAVADVVDVVRELCQVHALTLDTHELARAIAQRYGFALDNALIVAAALLAGCEVLYSDAVQADRKIEGRLAVRNPFRHTARSIILPPLHE